MLILTASNLSQILVSVIGIVANWGEYSMLPTNLLPT